MQKFVCILMLLLVGACGTLPQAEVAPGRAPGTAATLDQQTVVVPPAPVREVRQSQADLLLVDVASKRVEFWRRRGEGVYDLVFTGSALSTPRPEHLVNEVVVGQVHNLLPNARLSIEWVSVRGWTTHIGALESYGETLPPRGTVVLSGSEFTQLRMALANSEQGVDVIFHRHSYRTAPRMRHAHFRFGGRNHAFWSEHYAT